MARTPAAPKPKKSPLAAAAGSPLEAQAQAELDPVIQALTAAANEHAKASEAAITGYTNAYAHELGGINAAAPYDSAITGQAAVDAALRQALAGGGGDLASQLSSRLAALQGSSGAGALAGEAGALRSQGVSAGNTRLASGSAELGNLIANRAGAQSFDKKLPGLARLSGLQGIKQAEGNAQSEIASGTQQLESNIPTIVNELRSSRQQARALASENAYRQAEIGLSAQRNQISARRAQISAQQGQERINIEAQSAAQRALNENRSYRLSLARLGVSQKSLQLRWLSTEAKLKGGGYTPEETHRMQLTANQIAADGSKRNASLQQIMHTMALNDIPPSVAQKAAKLAGYKPGKPGMFTGLANFLVGTTGKGVKGGGMGRYGVPQGVGSDIGDAIGAHFAHSDNAGGFLPKGLGFKYDRHDQGRDIQTRAGAPIIAPGDGYVVRIAHDPGGGGAHFGPSYPIVYFTSGPYKGRYVYIGHTVAALRAGARFKAGSVLSRTQRSGPMNGGAPDGWAEIGFAPGGSPGAYDQPAPF